MIHLLLGIALAAILGTLAGTGANASPVPPNAVHPNVVGFGTVPSVSSALVSMSTIAAGHAQSMTSFVMPASATHGTHPLFGNASMPNDLHTRKATGSALVHNACSFPVRSNIVHAPRPGDDGPPEEIMDTLGPGATKSHPFSHDPDMGISWKVWRDDGTNHNPVQLEYTNVPSSGRTWYDLSMINAGTTEWLDSESHSGETIKAGANNDGSGDLTGMVAVAHPFGGKDEGMTLAPQGGAASGVIRCPAGQQYCTGAYNTDDDNQAMRDCAQSSDLKLTLCG